MNESEAKINALIFAKPARSLADMDIIIEAVRSKKQKFVLQQQWDDASDALAIERELIKIKLDKKKNGFKEENDVYFSVDGEIVG